MIPSPSDVGAFIEDEFLGVQGVRCQELFDRWSGERDELVEALKEIATRRRHKDGYYFEWKPWRDLEVETALLRLLGYAEWIEFFSDICEAGAGRLRGQAWQFAAELDERGVRGVHRSAVEDALLEFAAAFLPDSAAGREDPKALLFREAVAWLHERGGHEVVVAALGDPDLMDEAFEELTLSECRAFLRRRMRATSRAVAS